MACLLVAGIARGQSANSKESLTVLMRASYTKTVEELFIEVLPVTVESWAKVNRSIQ